VKAGTALSLCGVKPIVRSLHITTRSRASPGFCTVSSGGQRTGESHEHQQAVSNNQPSQLSAYSARSWRGWGAELRITMASNGPLSIEQEDHPHRCSPGSHIDCGCRHRSGSGARSPGFAVSSGCCCVVIGSWRERLECPRCIESFRLESLQCAQGSQDRRSIASRTCFAERATSPRHKINRAAMGV
jgi:hypothetical protein